MILGYSNFKFRQLKIYLKSVYIDYNHVVPQRLYISDIWESAHCSQRLDQMCEHSQL